MVTHPSSRTTPVSPPWLFTFLLFCLVTFGSFARAQGLPTIHVSDGAALENDTTNFMNFTFILSPPSSNVVTVYYGVGGLWGAAHPGIDFLETSGTVTFSPGSTSQVVSVVVLGDNIVENVGAVGLTCFNPTNAVVLPHIYRGTGTFEGLILDDDDIVVSPGYRISVIAGREWMDPSKMEFAPDGRLFVGGLPGRVHIVKNGMLTQWSLRLDTFYNGGQEQGLLGITFDPNFLSNQYVYVYYTLPFSGSSVMTNRLSRFKVPGDVPDASSEFVVFEVDGLTWYHHGGDIHFGPDGKLYLSTGDDYQPGNSQTLTNLSGKILRLNPDGAIPTDNPFYDQTTGKNKAIWALGLRNPFSFAFQPGTGRMFINDVGDQAPQEINEINEGIAGANYGSPYVEGVSSNAAYQNPVFSYTSVGADCFTAGVFYNPSTNALREGDLGDYFFTDYCRSWIKKLDLTTGTITQIFSSYQYKPLDLKIGPDGGLYCLASVGYGADSPGVVFKIERDPNFPSLSFLSLDSQGVQLSLQGVPGLAYTLEVSTNLLTWSDVSTLTNQTGTLQFTDPAATNSPHRFYRARKID